ncbi:MAG: two-component sensor histidine kinase [Desulfovibrio sp.]|nr:two-component sensor histidine kinase [Desulfovibrio sp.]
MVRRLAFIAMGLTFGLSVLVSIYLGNTARETLIRKNHNFASLLAVNLNSQIFRRFALPTRLIFGRVLLSNPEQHRGLDQVIQSIIQDLKVENLRIYAEDHTIVYSINPGEPGDTSMASPSVDRAAKSPGPIFDIEESLPYHLAFFKVSLPNNTYRLRTTYLMRAPSGYASDDEPVPVMGVLEFSQDITPDMESAVHFQQLTLVVTLLGSGTLMVLLLFLMRRAEHAIALRTAGEQRLLSELHQSEKLAGMGRVVASIAHEIRNPLGIISSSAQFLLDHSKEEDTGTNKILQAIYDEAKRLTRTVSDFLDYARPKLPKQDAVRVETVLDQALSFLMPELNARGVSVTRAGEEDTGLKVRGDKDLLYRAFYNIISNAAQAVVRGGTLTITLEKRGANAQGGQAIVLSFQDSGPGFPRENMDKLLDPFFTTKDDGTGLGLPIVNSIMTSHGGSLELFNAAEGGAVARLILPGMRNQE